MKTSSSSLSCLKASLLALLSLAAALVALPDWLQLVARRGTGLLQIGIGLHKDLGIAVQRDAFLNPHMLPVYGSSELGFMLFPNRPSGTFASGATGFQICPVGHPGNTSLLMAEKLTSLGSVITGKKLVILVSSSWFRRHAVLPAHYTGNFSELQAARIVTDVSLSYDLRHRFALRMMDYPETLADHRSLAKAVWRLRVPQEKGPVMNWLKQLPLRIQEMQLLAQDQAATCIDLLATLPFSGPLPDFDRLSPSPPCSLPGEKGGFAPAQIGLPPWPAHLKAGRSDDFFRSLMANAAEWDDFTLLLDTLVELKAKPFIIAIPMDGAEEDRNGISRTVRNTLYYDRMASLCKERGFAFDSLPDQEYNPGFLHEHRSHMTNEGWPYVNQMIDRFYHDLPPRAHDDNPKFLLVTSVDHLGSDEDNVADASGVQPPPYDELACNTPGKAKTFTLPEGGRIAFCYCPPGDFVMGGPTEEVGHEEDEKTATVHLSHGFWMACTECTQAQWKAFKPLFATDLRSDDLPVVNITWADVQDYLKALARGLKLPEGWKVRLPTEAEWEYACRAGTRTAFNFGPVVDSSEATWTGTFLFGTEKPGLRVDLPKTTPAASHNANAWGLHNMHGNVWEFCGDLYAPVLTGGTDPHGPATGRDRVVRGGSWNNYPVHCRSAARNFSDPAVPSTNVGFRPVLIYIGRNARGEQTGENAVPRTKP